MDSVYRNEILPNVHLTCITTKKFKTGCFSVNLVGALRRKTVSFYAVLPYVLLRGTALHPDMDSLTRLQEELYGIELTPIVRKKGEQLCFGLRATFADDDFLPKGENVLEKTASLLGELFLQPETRGGRFLGEYVEEEKEKLIQRIRAEVNNKQVYAYGRLSQLMCAGEPFGIGRLGSESTASKITLGLLTKYYRAAISQLPVEIFYCGAASPQRVEAALTEAFAALPREANAEEHMNTEKSMVHKEVRSFKETMQVPQGNLMLGFRINPTPTEDTVAPLMVLNRLFGSGSSSRLFTHVREKLSLCYYAYSFLEESKGLMIVSSGIAFENYQKALNEILLQLDEIRQGRFSDEEMAGAINALTADLQMRGDDVLLQEIFYLDRALSGWEQTPMMLVREIGSVTPQRVQDIAKNITLDSIYFLTGQEDDHAI